MKKLVFYEKVQIRQKVDGVHDRNKPRREKGTLDCHVCGKNVKKGNNKRIKQLNNKIAIFSLLLNKSFVFLFCR